MVEQRKRSALSRVAGGQVLVSHPDPPWLPVGGRADVVLADPGSVPPDPIQVVRLLLTHSDRILGVQREDGRGWDIPSSQVGASPVAAALRELVGSVFSTAGPDGPPTLLGWVRYVVDEAEPDYPWPTPDAYFAVYACALEVGREPTGTWLDPAELAADLSSRHWWPLAAQVLERAVDGSRT